MGDDRIDVFEVFKIGTLPIGELSKMKLEELSRKFTQLVPVTSFEQMKSGVALATLPSPNHVVVDRAKFQEMFKRETTQAANRKTNDLLSRVDCAIEKLKTEFKNEWLQSIQVLKDTIYKSITSLEEQLKSALENEKDIHKRDIVVAATLSEYRRTINIFFESMEAKQRFIAEFESAKGTESTDVQHTQDVSSSSNSNNTNNSNQESVE
jgi:hypothetical protein